MRLLRTLIPVLHRHDHVDSHVEFAWADDVIQLLEHIQRNLGAAGEAAERIAEVDELGVDDSRNAVESGDDKLLPRVQLIRVCDAVCRHEVGQADAEKYRNGREAVTGLDNVNGSADFLGMCGLDGKNATGKKAGGVEGNVWS